MPWSADSQLGPAPEDGFSGADNRFRGRGRYSFWPRPLNATDDCLGLIGLALTILPLAVPSFGDLDWPSKLALGFAFVGAILLFTFARRTASKLAVKSRLTEDALAELREQVGLLEASADVHRRLTMLTNGALNRIQVVDVCCNREADEPELVVDAMHGVRPGVEVAVLNDHSRVLGEFIVREGMIRAEGVRLYKKHVFAPHWWSTLIQDSRSGRRLVDPVHVIALTDVAPPIAAADLAPRGTARQLPERAAPDRRTLRHRRPRSLQYREPKAEAIVQTDLERLLARASIADSAIDSAFSIDHQDLRRALEAEELQLEYQPKFDLASRRIVGFEALLRWHHPRHGLIPPSVFVPLAEEDGLIGELDRWVLGEAGKHWRKWNSLCYPFVPWVSVNMSPGELGTPELADDIFRIIKPHGSFRHNLIIELTETSPITNLQAVESSFKRLREGGVRVALDDFGTAHSNLTYLANLSVDMVKIDQSFVQGLGNGKHHAVVKMVADHCRDQRISVVAEGVETDDVVVKLRDLGIGIGQGYWFSRPQRPEAITKLLSASAA